MNDLLDGKGINDDTDDNSYDDLYEDYDDDDVENHSECKA